MKKLIKLIIHHKFIISTIAWIVVVVITTPLIFTIAKTPGTDNYNSNTEISKQQSFGESSNIAATDSTIEKQEQSVALGNSVNSESNPTSSNPSKPYEPIPQSPPNPFQFTNAKQVESMTDAQLLAFATKSYQFIIPGFYERKLFGIPLKTDEDWGAISLSSASSVAQATNQIKDFGFVRDAVTHNIEFIGEDKYYYSFRITWSNLCWIDQNKQELISYTNRYLAYKENAMSLSFNDQTGLDIKFNLLDRQSMSDLLDLEPASRSNQMYGANLLYRTLEETANEYVYTYYHMGHTGGDWGMSDVTTLEKTTVKVDKTTGKYTSDWGYKSTVTLKQVTIPGTYHPNPFDE